MKSYKFGPLYLEIKSSDKCDGFVVIGGGFVSFCFCCIEKLSRPCRGGKELVVLSFCLLVLFIYQMTICCCLASQIEKVYLHYLVDEI